MNPKWMCGSLDVDDDWAVQQRMCTDCWECALIPEPTPLLLLASNFHELGRIDPPWGAWMATAAD